MKSSLLLTVILTAAATLVSAGATVHGKNFARIKVGPADPATLNRRQEDKPEDKPDTDICRWWGHASVIVGEKLYITGGTYTLYDDDASYKEGWTTLPFSFRSIDLRNEINLPIALTDRVVQSGVASDDDEPSEATSGGTLLADGENFLYKFGGKFPNPALGFKAPEAMVRHAQLWRYEINSPKWVSSNATSNDKIVRPYNSAYVSVPSIDKGFILGGMVSNDSDTAFFGLPVPGFEILGNSFLSLDLARGEFKNSSTPEFGPIAGASMVSVPEVGKKGILVMLGGVTQKQEEEWITPSNAGLVETNTLDHVYVYDIDSDKWFRQKTYGTSPPSRMSACATLVKSQDESLHNIIMYGGVSAAVGSRVSYRDTWMLSMPNFQWVLLNEAGESRFEHTCHAVKGNQLLVVGGRDVLQQSGNDLFNGNQSYTYFSWSCLENGLLSVMNLDTFEWTDSLPKNDNDFKVPKQLIDVIGGDETGNPKVTAPPDDFDDSALARIFATTNTPIPEPTSTNPPSETSSIPPDNDSKPPIGAIVGGVVGGVVALVAIGVLIWFLRRRSRSNAAADAAAATAAGPNPDVAQVSGAAPPIDPYYTQQQQANPHLSQGYYPPAYPPQYPPQPVGVQHGYEGLYAPPVQQKYDPQAGAPVQGGGYNSPTSDQHRFSYANQGGQQAPVELGIQPVGEQHYQAYNPTGEQKGGAVVHNAYEMPGQNVHYPNQQHQ